MKRDDVSTAIKALGNGEVIVYPTDTLYALGADVYNEGAVKKVFRIKKRPYSLPLPLAVANFNEIDKISHTNEVVKRVVKRFLPGPLTLLLKKKDSISSIVTGGHDTIAVRIPKNDIALEVLSRFSPITATSANIHGKKTSFFLNELKMQFRNDICIYLDNGRLNAPPSTIVDLTSKEPIIVRKGAITKEEILKVI
ncbi:MAG: threonylcarbamoyl-AMP synthase [Thermoplasmatales archaeon]|nr:MAG: threonylcarbamoyl-AMP synthase [Thermoplasmatales archaeon]